MRSVKIHTANIHLSRLLSEVAVGEMSWSAAPSDGPFDRVLMVQVAEELTSSRAMRGSARMRRQRSKPEGAAGRRIARELS
jgi:hypothetical protein